MGTSRSLLPLRLPAAAGVLLMLFLLAGSLADYPLSCALYDPQNLFGRFFAAFGEYPAGLGLTAAGVMLVMGRSPQRRAVACLQVIAGVWCVLSGAALTALLPMNYLPVGPAVSAAIGLVCTLAAALATRALCRGADRRRMLRLAGVFLLVIFGELLVVNCVKVLWGRPRMRLIAADPRAGFLPWWQPSRALRDALTGAGVAAEEFKSFPSGHTANASTLMLLALLPALRPGLQKRQTALFAAGFLWACVVGFSRIVAGAHFLSDVTMGLALGLLVLTAASRLLCRPEPEAPSASS